VTRNDLQCDGTRHRVTAPDGNMENTGMSVLVSGQWPSENYAISEPMYGSPKWTIPEHLRPTANNILQELLGRPEHRERLRHGDAHLYMSLCGAAARMALGPLPNVKQRQAYLRWNRQREWERVLMEHGDPVTLEKPDPRLPLPGRPYWRVSRGMPFDATWARRRSGRRPGRPRNLFETRSEQILHLGPELRREHLSLNCTPQQLDQIAFR
jgi:hypothetical protein